MQEYTVITRPVDKRENYIKTLHRPPGGFDTNRGNGGLRQWKAAGARRRKTVHVSGGNHLADHPIRTRQSGYHRMEQQGHALLHGAHRRKTPQNWRSWTTSLPYRKYIARSPNFDVFPQDRRYAWNQDNYGPIWIPQAGTAVALTADNLPLYRRIIETYEGNDLRVDEEGKIFINGEQTDTYTFRMNYYWMMGDNRDKSADSRYWGFVPEDHVVGKPIVVWLSLDKDRSWFDGKIRWNRIFKWVDNIK